MIWCVFFVFLALASARDVKKVDPAYLEALRSSGQDEEFAKLLSVDVSLVRSDDNEERSDGDLLFKKSVSPLGDILMFEEQEQERQGANFEKYAGSRWDNVIPYSITTNDYTEDEISFIERAIQLFNNKMRHLKLVQRSNEPHYVQIFSGNGCWSFLGRITGQQPMSLQRNGCLSVGTIQHEFIHAAGFAHEHNRADRDYFVRVLYNNIPENWHSQYRKVNEDDFKNIDHYDYYSVMHYPIWSPETGKDAFEILTLGINRNRLGQNDGVSDADVRKINKHYC